MEEVELYSFSELKTYMRCPKRYEYSRLHNLEKIGINVPADKGNWFHTLMMEDLLGNDWEQIHRDMVAEFDTSIGILTDDEDILSIPEDAYRMFQGYKAKYPDHFSRWKVLHVEESMSFELFPGVHIGFTPDLVAEDEYGGIWAWDHKTTQTIPQPGEMLVDLQNLTYSLGLRKLYGSRFKGFVFNYVRSKPPTMPKLRKDGLVSDVRRVDTTFDMLREFMIVNGIPRYPELNDRLAYLSTHDNFFKRDYFVVPDEALQRIFEELTGWVAKIRADTEMFNNFQDGVTTSPFSFGRVILPKHAGTAGCHRCPMVDICQADLLGIPRESILLDYQERTPLGRTYIPITEV